MRRVKFFVEFVFIFVANFTMEAMLPIKGVASLEKYNDIHTNLASFSIKEFAKDLNQKLQNLEKVDKKEKSLEEDANCLKAIVERKFLQSFIVTKKGKETNEEINTFLEKRRAAIIRHFKSIDTKFQKENIANGISEWYLNKLVEKIRVGDYSLLVASLPKELLVEGHIPNIFTAALTIIAMDNSVETLYLGENKKEEVEVCVFKNINFCFRSGESGDSEENKEAEFFCNSALRAYSNVLGGDLTRNSTRMPALNDLFAHSEQRAFFRFEKYNLAEAVKKVIRPSAKEIIFHGHTIKDMCSNCRTTLGSYEFLTTKGKLKKSIDNFLCALQKKFTSEEKDKVRYPIVTCVISSFIEGEDRKELRTAPNEWNSWQEIPCINLNKLVSGEEILEIDRTPAGICSGFVNQFAFSEKDFLEMLIPELEKDVSDKAGTLKTVVDALKVRKLEMDKLFQ